jgi:predicted ATPase
MTDFGTPGVTQTPPPEALWIERVTVERMKRFGTSTTFSLPGHMVLAGPNNAGKTTLLQAISAWHFAATYWLRSDADKHKRRAFSKVPVSRQSFGALPLRQLDLLWTNRDHSADVRIAVGLRSGLAIQMELSWDTNEQLYVRPAADSEAPVEGSIPRVVFVPPMTGLAISEPVYQAPKIAQLLALGRPGEVLRNVILQASNDDYAWDVLTHAIQRMFGYELARPNGQGADIVAEYRKQAGETMLDVASAGSGFQQVLMLVSLIATQPGTVLLVDEPDAHLHVILQHTIHQELKRIAAHSHSQIVLATHSEVILDTVDPTEICVILDQPRPLTDKTERTRLRDALRMIRNTDLMLVGSAPGILYLEGSTDLAILQAWSRVLDHPVRTLFDSPNFLWRPVVWEVDESAPGSAARKHFDALCLAKPELRALELLDGDSVGNQQATPLTGTGYQKVRWHRYEIESYLFHPAVLERFAQSLVGEVGAKAMHQYLADSQPPAFMREPLGDHPFLVGTKARTDLLPPALTAAGLPDFPYTRFDEIAAVMQPEEIHFEVKEKLDAICVALRWTGAASGLTP